MYTRTIHTYIHTDEATHRCVCVCVCTCKVTTRWLFDFGKNRSKRKTFIVPWYLVSTNPPIQNGCPPLGLKAVTPPRSLPHTSPFTVPFFYPNQPPSPSLPPRPISFSFPTLHTLRSLSLFQPSGSHFLLLFSPKSRAK